MISAVNCVSHTHIYAHTHTYHTHTDTHIHIPYTCTHTCIHMCMYAHVYTASTHICIHMHTYSHLYTHTHIPLLCTHTYLYTYTHIHRHANKYTHAGLLGSSHHSPRLETEPAIIPLQVGPVIHSEKKVNALPPQSKVKETKLNENEKITHKKNVSYS